MIRGLWLHLCNVLTVFNFDYLYTQNKLTNYFPPNCKNVGICIMTVIVNIWKPGHPKRIEWLHGRAGHASMHIEILGNSLYVSFWPKKGRARGSSRGAAALIFGQTAEVIQSYQEDVRRMTYEVDHRIHIEGLLESKVIEYWGNLNQQKIDYNFFSQNCCICVEQALMQGLHSGDIPVISGSMLERLLIDRTRKPRNAVEAVKLLSVGPTYVEALAWSLANPTSPVWSSPEAFPWWPYPCSSFSGGVERQGI